MSVIGVLGGSFDPIHKGHRALGCAAVREVALDKLIVMPTHIQPFKQNKRVAQDMHRLAMVALAFEGCEHVEISDYEIKKGDVSYSYETMSHLREVYPDDELFFIMGADSFINVEKWYKGEELLSEFGFIVSSRPGYPERELESKIRFYKEDYGTKIIRLRSKMPDISSTEIREAFIASEPISHLVPRTVEKYINDNRLYDDVLRNLRWNTKK
ncbi:MAG: nicotinate (nicotinamide) nucleotide adenylyltransferase [Firmicutes bacterium]|nr:nicotinate (nicotinamide) nucleotide adenylyltransferase [Bacillota bacterium]